MGQLRRNLLTGRWVVIALERAARPADLDRRHLPVEAGPRRLCPFCPGNEEDTPPALEAYGPGGRWLVRIVPNLYPAFDGDAPMSVVDLGPVWNQAPASGLHEVLVLSPAHDRDLPDFDDRQAGLVMAAVRDRLEMHARHQAIRYTQVLVNHGREAGASLEHPHGQLLGMPFVPGELTEELNGFSRFADSNGTCLLCTTWTSELDAGHRLVLDTDRVSVLCPFWSGSPYEMLIVPKEHAAHIARAAPQDVAAVGHALRSALDRLGRAANDPAYNVVFHTAPHHDGEATFHWHVHVMPRITSVAGFEQGTGVLINIVPPELAAQRLRTITQWATPREPRSEQEGPLAESEPA
jgi:UDPglucose--hexose-1-phosphate uridylyltransferase